MYIKLSGVFLMITVSTFVEADIQHHNFAVNTCRALQSGDLQIQGVSETDNQSRRITFSATSFQEKVVDRYASFCMASLTSGSKLRIDYLYCTGINCETTPDTTISFYKL